MAVPVAQHLAGAPALPAGTLEAAGRRWEATRAAARASAKPDGYVLETSFTSMTPTHGWTLDHAVRELWQNLRDGLVAAFSPAGGPLVEFDARVEAPNNVDLRIVHLEAAAGVVGSVRSSRGELLLQQRFAVLETKHLLLASTKDDHDRAAGCHGEGFKVAVNFLLQRGFSVTYTMDGAEWSFAHAALHDAIARTMIVKMRRTGEARDDLVVAIRGPGAEKLFKVGVDFDLLRASYTPRPGVAAPFELCILRRQHLLVTTEPALAGRVYNRFIFVDSCDQLKSLGLCVNVSMDLQRDRHALPANLPRKTADVVQEAFSEHGTMSDAVRRLCEHLLERFKTNSREAEWLAPAMREVLRLFCAARAGVQPADVVFLKRTDESDVELARAVGMYAVTDAGPLEEGNLDDIVEKRVLGLPDAPPAASGSEAARCFEQLGKLSRALYGVNSYYAYPLRLKTMDAPFAKVAWSLLSDERCLLLSSACVADRAALRSTAPMLYGVVSRGTQLSRQAAMGPVLASFLADPDAFDPAQFPCRPPGANSGRGSGGGGGRGGGGGARVGGSPPPVPATARGAAAGAAATPPPPPPPPTTRLSDMRLDDDRVDLRQPRSDGPQRELDVDEAPSYNAGCRVPNTTLEDVWLPTDEPEGAVLVLIDPAVRADEAFASAGGALATGFAAMHGEIQALRARIQATLGMTDFPLTYVLVPGVLGYNYRGHVYLNVWILKDVVVDDARSRRGAVESVLRTLLHELAHFRHRGHDSDFADLLAKLVWKCRNCLTD